MKKKLLSAVVMLCGMTLGLQAQDKVYLMKDGKVVATYPVNGVDYLTFTKPAAAEGAESLTPVAEECGKNYIKYTVKTATDDQYYGHGFFQSQTLDMLLQRYYGTSIDQVDQATLKEVMKLLLNGYGYLDQGTQTFTIKNGESDGYDTDFFIPGGQDFYVATVNITSADATGGVMGDEVSVIKLTTKPAGVSKETLGLEYIGLNDDNEALYNITPSDGIRTFYTLLTKKSQLDQYVTLYGLEYMLFAVGTPWTVSDWQKWGDQASWELNGEDDYVMSVMGVDENGDWVKNSSEEHIVVQGDNCPKVNIFNKEAGDGNVEVSFEITPSNVKAAHIRLIKDNDVEDELNRNKTLDQIAVEGDAVDIKAVINETGEYTFSKSDLPRGWYSLLISGTDDNGTNVTRLVFHTHLDNFEWEITTSTFPTDAVAMAKGMKVKAINAAATKAMAMPKAGTKSANTIKTRKLNTKH